MGVGCLGFLLTLPCISSLGEDEDSGCRVISWHSWVVWELSQVCSPLGDGQLGKGPWGRAAHSEAGNHLGERWEPFVSYD